MIELAKGNIKLQIQKPEEGYSGSRFDWTGKIVQVWWNGIPLCPGKQLKGKDDNTQKGFFNEFSISNAMDYNKCKIGEYFPKIGVGLLKKVNDQPYDFFTPYSIKPLGFGVQIADVSLLFHCLNKRFEDAFFLEKEIKVTDDGFVINYLLENIGTRVIETSEYVHSFLSLGNKRISSNALSFGGHIKTNQFENGLNPKNGLYLVNHSIQWKKPPANHFFFKDIAESKMNKSAWQLTSKETGVRISEVVDFKPSKINLWGRDYTVCVEVFKNIKLMPGEKEQWQRKFQISSL